MGIRETEFQEHLPEFTDAEGIKFLSGDGEIVSVFGRGGIPDLFVVAFATRKGRIGPIALNPLVAKILAASLQEHLQKIGALPPTPQQGA